MIANTYAIVVEQIVKDQRNANVKIVNAIIQTTG